MNAPIRLIVLACFGAATLVFLLSNRQPLPLVLFGRSLPALPIAIWVLAFGSAGLLSGLLLQILPRLGKSSRAERPSPQPSVASGRPQQQRERPEIANDRAGWGSAGDPDWEAPSPAPVAPDEWNIEEPPAPQAAVDPERLRRPRPERERAQMPADDIESDGGSLEDDFNFPAADESDAGVVDAPYRLIDPPRWSDDRPDSQEENDRNS